MTTQETAQEETPVNPFSELAVVLKQQFDALVASGFAPRQAENILMVYFSHVLTSQK